MATQSPSSSPYFDGFAMCGVTFEEVEREHGEGLSDDEGFMLTNFSATEHLSQGSSTSSEEGDDLFFDCRELKREEGSLRHEQVRELAMSYCVGLAVEKGGHSAAQQAAADEEKHEENTPQEGERRLLPLDGRDLPRHPPFDLPPLHAHYFALPEAAPLLAKESTPPAPASAIPQGPELLYREYIATLAGEFSIFAQRFLDSYLLNPNGGGLHFLGLGALLRTMIEKDGAQFCQEVIWDKLKDPRPSTHSLKVLFFQAITAFLRDPRKMLGIQIAKLPVEKEEQSLVDQVNELDKQMNAIKENEDKREEFLYMKVERATAIKQLKKISARTAEIKELRRKLEEEKLQANPKEIEETTNALKVAIKRVVLQEFVEVAFTIPKEKREATPVLACALDSLKGNIPGYLVSFLDDQLNPQFLTALLDRFHYKLTQTNGGRPPIASPDGEAMIVEYRQAQDVEFFSKVATELVNEVFELGQPTGVMWWVQRGLHCYNRFAPQHLGSALAKSIVPTAAKWRESVHTWRSIFWHEDRRPVFSLQQTDLPQGASEEKKVADEAQVAGNQAVSLPPNPEQQLLELLERLTQNLPSIGKHINSYQSATEFKLQICRRLVNILSNQDSIDHFVYLHYLPIITESMRQEKLEKREQ